MMATSNSGRRRGGGDLLPITLAIMTVVFRTQAESDDVHANRFARLYEMHRDARQGDTNDCRKAWESGRACFDWADFATNKTQRASLANEGIAACRRAIALCPTSAPAQLYLGVNLGQLARVKLFTALGLLDDMEAAFRSSIALDPQFDFAVAHRSLGLLYRDAPGWPTSLGSRTKARRHLLKAAELFPDYPANQLALIESLLEWGEHREAQERVLVVEATLEAARGRFTGDEWAWNWIEWERQWNRIRSKLRPPAKERPSNRSETR